MKANTDLAIGRRIARIRRAKGLTQSEVGEKINMSTQTEGKSERGERSITAAEIENFARALNVPEQFLLKDIPEDIMDQDLTLLSADHLYKKAYMGAELYEQIAAQSSVILQLLDFFLGIWINDGLIYKNNNESESIYRVKGSLRKVINQIRNEKYITAENTIRTAKLIEQMADVFFLLLIQNNEIDIKNGFKDEDFSEDLNKLVRRNKLYRELIFAEF